MGRFLDWVVSNDSDNLYIYESRSPLSKVDKFHPPLEISIDVIDYRPSLATTPRNSYNFKRDDLAALSVHLSSANFDQLANLDLDTALDKFYSIMYGAFDRYVPVSTLASPKHPPWHNKQLANLFEESQEQGPCQIYELQVSVKLRELLRHSLRIQLDTQAFLRHLHRGYPRSTYRQPETILVVRQPKAEMRWSSTHYVLGNRYIQHLGTVR